MKDILSEENLEKLRKEIIHAYENNEVFNFIMP